MPISIISRKDISFPKLKWSIKKNETKLLPEDEESQKIILVNPYTQILVVTNDIKNPPESYEPDLSDEKRTKVVIKKI